MQTTSHPIKVQKSYAANQDMITRVRIKKAKENRPSHPFQRFPVSSLASLMRERKTWTPNLLLGVLWRALTNFGTIRQIHSFIGLPPFAELAHLNPRFPFKYLTHDYLARHFTVKERLACFLHHHRRMHQALPSDILHRTLFGDVTIHEFYESTTRFTLTMGLPQASRDKEGELSLNMQVDGEAVFNLPCNIVPGWVVRSDAKEVLLITRLQGLKGYYPQIRHATKSLHDVAPGALLLAGQHKVSEPHSA